MRNTLLDAGEYEIRGYAGELIAYTVKKQLLDGDTFKLFVEQFRTAADGGDGGWRGEFWGKMMRGGALTYAATKDEKLYGVLADSVADMLSVRQADGRISTYGADKELCGWDMWCRKYVMLGMLYFHGIAKTEKLKKRIEDSLCAQADYIVQRVGDGDGKISIFDTSAFWGGLNSCSILEPFVKLYRLTGQKRYLDFAAYIVESGFCKDMNLIELCLERKVYPYMFAHTKAYEMMSCFRGLLEYCEVTGEQKYLVAAKNFVDMVVESDYTVIGCCGCTHELFDNSSVMQTEQSDEVMQETCVTVTLIDLCCKLFLMTGDEKYIDIVERSSLNALYGAVNDGEQTMARSEGRVWIGKELALVEHESFPFDSYSPLFMSRRARRVGGFKQMAGGRSYGCCACIGSAGTALSSLVAITRTDSGFSVNTYGDMSIRAKRGYDTVGIDVAANPYGAPRAKLNISGGGNAFELRLRAPEYMKSLTVRLNGAKLDYYLDGGYIVIDRVWGDDAVELEYKLDVVARVLNGKVAFTRGAVVLARDCRLGDIKEGINKIFADGEAVDGKSVSIVQNGKFDCNLAVRLTLGGKSVELSDYASAGRNYDDGECDITVWQFMGDTPTEKGSVRV